MRSKLKEKKREEMRKKEKQKGITLIALVITIVVLLILAGVSISMITGDNGVITNAQKSKLSTTFSAYKEEVDRSYCNPLFFANIIYNFFSRFSIFCIYTPFFL